MEICLILSTDEWFLSYDYTIFYLCVPLLIDIWIIQIFYFYKLCYFEHFW